MALVDLDSLEAKIIETIRAARASEEKNASRQIKVAQQNLKIHVQQVRPGLWDMRVVTKRGS